MTITNSINHTQGNVVYPTSATANQLQYASSTTAISGLATANNGTLVTSNTGVPSILAGPGTTGQILQSNAAAAPSFSTASYPSTAGTSGNVLTSNGTNFISSATASFVPNANVLIFDDFISAFDVGVNGYILSNYDWYAFNGTQGVMGFTVNTATDSSHPGILASTSLTSGDIPLFLGGTGTFTPKGAFVLGGGILTINWVINIVTLSSSNRYNLRVGLGDTFGADQVNGCYVEYSDNINSGNWDFKTASASTRTTSTSSVAVGTGWNNIQIQINAAASSVSFSVNGVSLGTAISTNIPTVGISPFIDINWVAGTVGAGSIIADLMYLTQPLTTPR